MQRLNLLGAYTRKVVARAAKTAHTAKAANTAQRLRSRMGGQPLW